MNSIKAQKLHNISLGKILIIIDENKITFTDNCKGFSQKRLDEIKNLKQKGLGIKMSSKILNKSNWSMNIENTQDGAKFILYKKDQM